MKKFALVGALAALTIATASCGGGSDTLSEDEYLDELQDLCLQVDGDLEDLGEPEDYRDLARLGEDAREIIEDGLADIQELVPPDDLEADHEDYVASIERTIDLTGDFIAAAEDEDEAELTDLSVEIEDEEAEREEIAEDIGADDCIDDDDPDPDGPTDTTIEDEPADTTEPDEPADTTEPDEPADTTEPDDDPTETTVDQTIPRITVPPIDMTMPTETEPPVMQGSEIGTIDIVNELPLPAGYTFENADAETLTGIQELYAEAFAGQIAAIGGAGVVDDATGEVFSAFVFFWNADLDDVTGPAFVDDLAAADDVASTETVATPNGLVGDRILYTDDTEALVVWGGEVSIVLFGDAGSAASLGTLMDAIATA
jgi:hypothetical protein